jgi:hypothetical protein
VIVALGCGPNTQQPSNPTGSITGTVTDLRTGTPLAGVTVSALAAGDSGVARVTATTEATGAYALRGLPAGATYRVRFTKDNFVARFGSATIPNATGMFPQGNAEAELNMPLAASDAAIAGRVLAGGAAPAVGAVVGVDLRAMGFDLVTQATVAADGTYRITGLPGAPTGLMLMMVTQPWDANSDGLVDYDTVTVPVQTFPGSTARVDVDLRSAAGDLVLLYSDIDDGIHPPNQPIDLTFNRPIRVDSVTLLDVTSTFNVAVVATLDAAGTALRVTTAGGTALSLGSTYRLDVTATTATGISRTFRRSFQATTTTSPLPAVQGLTLTPVDANYDTTAFQLAWTAIPGAAGYRIYARDTLSNPTYLLLSTVGSSPAPATSLTLPTSFDVFTADGLQTPFAFGTRVDVAVVATDAVGNAASPDTAAPVSRADTMKPSVVSADVSGNANNTSGSSPRTITLRVRWSEYLHPTRSNIAIQLPHPALTSTFLLDPTAQSGTFTIVIPAGVNGAGAYTVTGAVDTSGNVMDPYAGTLTGITACPGPFVGSGSNGGSGAVCLGTYTFNTIAGNVYTISTCNGYSGDTYLRVTGTCACSSDDACGAGSACTCLATANGTATICASTFGSSPASWSYTVTGTCGP